jgi:glycosyltransferase involved in cell wall biosynthesis
MVEILLAAYNGEKYLREQLDSIFAQTFKDFIITVRDDGSSDGTLDIINEYRSKFPEKIKLLPSEGKNSREGNFKQLLRNANSGSYFCFCCQDDVWQPNKLEREMVVMRRIEGTAGERTPVLVHCDMAVTDEDLNVTEKSYVKFANIKPQGFSLKTMLAENCTIGTSCLFNMALLSLARNVPDNAVSAAWWVGLYAAVYGRVEFIDEPLVLYRQHGDNLHGAVGGRFTDILKNKSRLHSSKFDTQKSYYQAEEFLKANAGRINPEKQKIIETYASFVTASKGKKVMEALFGGYAKNSLLASIIQAVNS